MARSDETSLLCEAGCLDEASEIEQKYPSARVHTDSMQSSRRYRDRENDSDSDSDSESESQSESNSGGDGGSASWPEGELHRKESTAARWARAFKKGLSEAYFSAAISKGGIGKHSALKPGTERKGSEASQDENEGQVGDSPDG